MVEKLSIDELHKLLHFISKGYKVPQIVHDVIRKIAKIEIEDKEMVVLLKRDPDIGSRRLQGMKVKITDGTAIELYPLSIVGFGADFDGDSMIVNVVLSKQAQSEIRSKMITPNSNESFNAQNYAISNEMILGLYVLSTQDLGGSYLSLSYNIKDLTEEQFKTLKDQNPGKRVTINYKGNKLDTTVGKCIINSILPQNYNFVDYPLTKKSISKLLSKIIEIDKNLYGYVINKFMKLGFYYATLYPKTISLDMLTIPENIKKLKVELDKTKDLKTQSEIVDKMENLMIEHLKKNVPELYAMVNSGASKDKSQVRQIMISKGLIRDPGNNILPPIVNSFSDGYTTTQYFNAAAGARAGIIGRALNTAYGGYEYRKVLFILSSVKANLNNPDCETKDTLNIKLTEELYNRMNGRFVIKDKQILPISEDMIGSIIKLRSPVYCQSFDICKTCYGRLIYQIGSEQVGVIAAQEVASLSERFMKAFHLGGIVKFDKVDIKKELMQNIDNAAGIYLNNFEQKDISLYAKSNIDAKIRIEVSYNKYVEKYSIMEDEKKFDLPVGYFTLYINNFSISVTTERETILYKTDKVIKNSDKLVIEYAPGDEIFTFKAATIDYTKITQKLDELISGKTPAQGVIELYQSLFGTLKATGNFDSVHLEILLSNILRAKQNPQLPARLKRPFDYETFSIKALPSLISWDLGLAFENFNRSLAQGLISDRGIDTEIGRILSGQSIARVKKEEQKR